MTINATTICTGKTVGIAKAVVAIAMTLQQI